MSENTNTARPKMSTPIKGHIKPGTQLKPGTAAHTALLKSAGLAPATKEKPTNKKPVVSK